MSEQSVYERPVGSSDKASEGGEALRTADREIGAAMFRRSREMRLRSEARFLS